MTLLICVFGAIISTVIWYNSYPDKKKTGTLCLIYWGASIMWFVDTVVEYLEIGADYFTPSLSDMINDSFLGLSVIALGLMIWLAVLFVKDPEGRIKAALKKE